MYSKVARDIGSLSAPPSAQTDQVIQILEAYLAELEQGGIPHPDALITQYPEHAEVLRAYLKKLELLHEAATGLRGSPGPEGTTTSADGASNRRLGDYTILREVGRGGMGLVYEAFQVSLSRRVALKVLPFAAALDPRQLRTAWHASGRHSPCGLIRVRRQRASPADPGPHAVQRCAA